MGVKFSEGDIVRRKSGGARMRVTRVREYRPSMYDIICIHLDGPEQGTERAYPIADLVKVN